MTKDVVGFEGFYTISSEGVVASVDRLVNNNGTQVFKKGCVMKPFVNASGYLQVRLSKNGTSKVAYVHKLVAEAFVRNSNNYTEVNHIDHNKLNCQASNLEWCTRKHNVEEMVKFHRLNGSMLWHSKIGFCKNCNLSYHKKSKKGVYCSPSCYNKHRSRQTPSLDTLLQQVETYGFSGTGRLHGVSDNTVRKWIKKQRIVEE